MFQPHFNILNRYPPQYSLDRHINLFANAAEDVSDIPSHRTLRVWPLPVEGENTGRFDRSVYVEKRYLFWFACQTGSTARARLGNNQVAVRQIAQHSSDYHRIGVDAARDLF